MKAIWLRIALVNFLIAAIMGVLMRYAFVQEIPWMRFKAFLHGHSHGAMLGWLYLALFSLLIGSFLNPDQQQDKWYNRLFWITEAAVLGMFISFPIQGYGLYSILFSTIHILSSYAFALRFWRHLRADRSYSAGLARLALGWMIFSTLGVWAMSIFIQGSFRGTAWYYMSVQFFLHFQFNGWFLFGALALFFRWLERRGIAVRDTGKRHFLVVMVVATLLTFALSVAWSTPHPAVFAANSAGVLIQLWALWILRQVVTPALLRIREQVSGWTFLLWRLALFSFIGKVLIQASVVIPAMAKIAYTIRNFVIGFVHLILLGVLSLFIFAFLSEEARAWFSGKWVRAGVAFFALGFILSELLLFLQGTMFWMEMGFLPHYYLLLFAMSMLMPLGIAFILGGLRRDE